MSADVVGRDFPRCDLHADDLVLSARAANTNGGVLLCGINCGRLFRASRICITEDGWNRRTARMEVIRPSLSTLNETH